MVVVYRTSLLGAKLRATRMRWEFLLLFRCSSCGGLIRVSLGVC